VPVESIERVLAGGGCSRRPVRVGAPRSEAVGNEQPETADDDNT